MELKHSVVSYIKKYTGNEVTSIIAEVRVPAIDGDVSGYAKLGSIEGWTLSDNDTKLSKEYTTNQTEIIEITILSFNGVIFDPVGTQQSIEIYDITSSEYVRVIVEYARESGETEDKLISANVIVKIKDKYMGSYSLSSNNVAWVVSEDGTFMSRDIEINGNFTEPCYIFPAGETDTSDNRLNENISFKLDNVGLTITLPEITYTEKKCDDDVIGVEASVVVPYAIDNNQGHSTLGNIKGWLLTDNNTKLVKTFLDNENEIITIPVLEANGYEYTTLTFTGEVKVNTINYKKVVKGRCEVSMCMYDVYTKAEIENLKLKLEQQIKELKALK